MQEVNLEFLLKKTIEDYIKKEVAADRKTTFDQLFEIYQLTGSKSFVVKLPDGEKVATFTINEPKPREEVDEERLIAWLEENGYEDQILTKQVPAHEVKTIKTGVLGAIGAELTKEGHYVTPMGEIVEGVQQQPAAAPTNFTVRYEGGDDGRRRVIEAWQDGDLAGIVNSPTLPEIGTVEDEQEQNNNGE